MPTSTFSHDPSVIHDDDDEALTVKEAASTFGVSLSSVRRRIYSGEVVAAFKDRQNYVLRSDIGRALAPKLVVPTQAPEDSSAVYPEMSNARFARLSSLLSER